MKRIAIVAAWEPELTYLHQHYPSHRIEKRAAWEFHFHHINELEIISVITGVGKVNCASCVQLLISEFQPEQLFMTGICGSLSEKVKNGHIVVALKTLQHDVTAAGTGVDSFDLYTGRTATIETTKYLVKQMKKCVPMILYIMAFLFREINTFVAQKRDIYYKLYMVRLL